MQPTKQFNDGAMLPLMGVLDSNKHVRALKLATAGMHDARFRYELCLHDISVS